MTDSGVEYRTNPRFMPDNMSIKFGTGGDSRLYYDGSDLVVSPADVGTGDLKVSGASLLLDSGEKIDFGAGDVTLSHAAAQLHIDGGDLIVADGNGLVIGHTAQITAPGNFVPEFQVLGTGVGGDIGIHVSRHSADAGGPVLTFGKGRDAIGTFTTALSAGDNVGMIEWGAADGTDMVSRVARIQALMDGNAGSNDTPGRLQFETTAPGSANAIERMRIDSAGGVFINESANANMTVGLTINQGSNDNQILAFKSSDVSSGLTTGSLASDVEIDDFYVVSKLNNLGGVSIQAVVGPAITSTYFVESYGGPPATTDTSASLASMNWFAAEHNGSNGLIDMAANSNAFAWGEISGAGARLTRMLLKADDGELHLGNTTLVGLDAEDDIQIIRAMQKASANGGIIESDLDNPFYDYDRLRELGLAGEMDDEGFFLFPLQSRLHAHEGAMWQLYKKLVDTIERLAITESKLAGLLPTGA